MTETGTAHHLGLTLDDRDGFLDLFYEPVILQVNRRTECKLSVLKVENGNFILDRLYDVLANASLTYVLSRNEVRKFLAEPFNAVAWVNRVQAKFQEPNDTNGEGGEVLLYAFLEAVVGAPKLLSKMELKTNNRMPVYGSDGLHFLKSSEGQHQIIYGESKMYGELGQAISNAFESINEASMNQFRHDLSLVSPQLMKEAVSPEQLDYLEEILVPPSSSGVMPPRPAFGIFLGFDIDVDDYSKEEFDDSEIEAEFQYRARDAIESKVPLISKNIKKYNLGATPIHIFAVPFLKQTVNGRQHGVADVRRNIQQRLRFGHTRESQDVA